jgi:hypothetical protein
MLLPNGRVFKPPILHNYTHRMFLEQNTLEINEHALITIRSSRPFDTFEALCAGSELQKICMDSSRLICRSCLAIAELTKSVAIALSVSRRSRVARMAPSIGGFFFFFFFLETLRQDWMDHGHDECSDPWCESEHDEHDSCTFGHDVEFCDIHHKSVLY